MSACETYSLVGQSYKLGSVSSRSTDTTSFAIDSKPDENGQLHYNFEHVKETD